MAGWWYGYLQNEIGRFCKPISLLHFVHLYIFSQLLNIAICWLTFY